MAGVLALSCTPTVIPELSLSDLAANFEASGSLEKSISVTSNVDWTVSCPDAWVTVSPNSGTGNGTFKISVTANEKFEARSSTVTVKAGDKTASVRVSQLSLTPSILVSPTTLEVDADGGNVSVEVTSNSPWTVTVPEDCGWIAAEPASGEGSAQVTLTVAASDVREARSAAIKFQETVGNTEMTVTVNQAAVPLGHKADSLALVAIYDLADGANWKDSRKWTLTEPIDTWPGVKLNEEGRVVELNIINGTVTTVEWEIPAVLTELSELSTLQIVGSKLKGEIPEFLYGMTSLAKIRFNTNNLTGSLSDKISQWTNLTELYLNDNKELGGNIPATIGQLKKLESINIAQTAIGGAIPEALAECTALKNFMAYSNQLSGEIPDFWDKLPNIGALQLYGNPGLVGPIPASIGTLKSATGIQLKDCNLTGNIPASFGGLEKCSNLMLSGNKLSGVIPAEVQAHPKFQATTGWKYETNILPQQEGYVLRLEPDYRQLDSLALVAIYDLADGANWKDSRKWTLTEPIDTWPGVKLNEEGRVVELNIINGTVTTVEWEIPAVLTELSELSTLQIVGSKLKGEIPEFLYGMTSLAKIRFNTNNLTGSLSDKISQWTNLTELYLNDNKELGGNIPATIGQLKKLESINIAQTAIGGAIPEALAECTALKNFMAYSNQLSGEIPDFWDKLPNIGALQLYGNPGLVGPIPASIGTLKSATGIQLKDCNLTGNIPASFGGLEKCSNLMLSGNKLSGVIPAEVQAHPKFQATTGWKYETNILPQQEGFGLTLE